VNPSPRRGRGQGEGEIVCYPHGFAVSVVV
jgi:hypothetical protein